MPVPGMDAQVDRRWQRVITVRCKSQAAQGMLFGAKMQQVVRDFSGLIFDRLKGKQFARKPYRLFTILGLDSGAASQTGKEAAVSLHPFGGTIA